MKKLICIAAAFALLLALAACGRDEPLPTESDTSATEQPTEAPTTEAPTAEPTEAPTDAPQGPTACALVGEGGKLFRNERGEVWLSAWITVRNTGTSPVELPPMDVTASVDGTQIKTLSSVTAYPNVLAAGEVGCYYDEARVDTDLTGEAQLTYELAPRNAQDADIVRYTPSDDTQLRDSVYGGLTMVGEITDDNPQTDAGMTCVAAVLYDAEDAVVCVLYEYLTDPLPVGESVGFTLDSFMLPEDITAASIARYEIFAYPA